MKTVGIVCEYNPFHLGHAYQLEKSRELAGAEAALVCVMSGDFVQRGEAALYDKFARAEAACRCGADLVVELPLPWALASAEGFARGAVQLLGGLGVNALSFGSEAGQTEPLARLARCLLEPGTVEAIRVWLARDQTLSFASARQALLSERLGPEAAALLSQPNNILAVEYLKAVYSLNLPMEVFTVQRLGAGHDGRDAGPGPRSASQLRELRAAGKDIDAFLPAPAAQVFRREREAGRELCDRRLLEAALLSRLRLLREEDFDALPDAAGGLDRRIFRAVQREGSLDAIVDAASGKRYTRARVRRVCLCACLGLGAEMSAGTPPYARVLAASGRGRALLRELDGRGLPLLTKPAAVRKLGGEAERLFSLGSAAHDLYVLGREEPSQRQAGEDWRRGPFLG